MPHCSLSTTLRITSDICGKRNIIHPASALRIIDDHLHATGIIPYKEGFLAGESSSIYPHDWFCVSQAVTCYPVSHLLNQAVRIHQHSHSHTWVLPKIGKSSIEFGSAITLGEETLATACRVFARRKTTGGADAFTETERERFLHSYGLLGDGIGGLEDSSREAIPFDLTSKPLPLPERLNTNFDAYLVEEPILSVKIGPQHVNLGHHADHAFLAETAAHALSLAENERGKKKESPCCYTLSIQYVSEAMLNQTLHCHVYENGRYVSIIGESSDGEKKIVLGAEQRWNPTVSDGTSSLDAV